jgi:hypothetical protein
VSDGCFLAAPTPIEPQNPKTPKPQVDNKNESIKRN